MLGPLLPVRARVSGLLVLGGSRVTLARALDVDDAALRAVLDVRRRVQEAVDLLGWDDTVLSLVDLRRWDPDAGAVTPVVCVP